MIGLGLSLRSGCQWVIHGGALSCVGGCAAPITFDIRLEDRRVMNEPVNGGHRHTRVQKDVVPAGEWLVGGSQKAFSLVFFGDRLEQRAGFGLVLPSLDVSLMARRHDTRKSLRIPPQSV